MPIIVSEAARSGPFIVNWNEARVTRLYNIQGAENELAAKEALNGWSPLFWLGLRKNEIAAEPQGGGFWSGRVEYVNPQAGELQGQNGLSGGTSEGGGAAIPPQYEDETKLGSEMSLSSGSGTTHITQSLATINRYPDTAKDYRQAIGVSKDGIAGTDIHSPAPEFSITNRVEYVTMAYWRRLCEMQRTSPMNAFKWNTFPPHTLLFLGISGDRYIGNSNGDDSRMMTFRFAYSATLKDIVIRPNTQAAPNDNGLTVAIKRGWDYLWCTYKDSEVDGDVVKIADAAYVERVYGDCDYVKFLGF